MGDFALTYHQQALWLLAQMIPGAQRCALNLCYELRFRGKLTVSALRLAVLAAGRHHRALGTRIRVRHGEVRQVLGAAAPTLAVVDLRPLPDPFPAAEAIVRKEARRSMDLDEGALAAFVLVVLGEEEHRLVMNLHHVIADGVSIQILRRDMATLYTAALAGEPVRLAGAKRRYEDFVALWTQGCDEKGRGAEELYWRRMLPSKLERLDVPLDFERPRLRSFRGDGLEVPLEHDLIERCQRRSFHLKVPLSSFLLTAFAVLLSRKSGQRRMIVGTSFAGRRQGDPWRDAVGFLANTVLLALDLGDGATATELIGRVSDCFVGAYDHQEYPLQLLIQRISLSRDVRRPVLFQAAFNYQATSLETQRWGNLLETGFERVHTPTSTLELFLHVTKAASGTFARFEYCTDLFLRETIADLAKGFSAVLEELESATESQAPRRVPDGGSRTGNRVQIRPEVERK